MSAIRDRTWATSALAASMDFRAVLSRAFSPFSVAPAVLTRVSLRSNSVRGAALRARRAACAVELDFGQLQLAVGLGDRGVDLDGLSLLLGDGRLGSSQLRLEGDGVHFCDDLAGTDHVPLADEDRLDPARLLRGHVHLDRLDPPVSRGDSRRQRRPPGLPGLPGEDPAPGQERQ